jgi:hypothetical protein
MATILFASTLQGAPAPSLATELVPVVLTAMPLLHPRLKWMTVLPAAVLLETFAPVPRLA